MKRLAYACAVGFIGLLVGCEYEGGDSFNTSQGAGVNVNFSGVYTGRSGALVRGKNVSRLLITQTGNAVEVTDNNNRTYKGAIGSPGVVGAANSAGNYSVGAEMLQSQINFANDNANFVGIIRAVAVTDIKGYTITVTTETEDSTEHVDVGDDYEHGNTNMAPGTTVSEGDVDTETHNESQTTTREDKTEFSVNEGNTQYVLEGNWVEGGRAFAVSGFARAVSGSFTTAATSTATTTTP